MGYFFTDAGRARPTAGRRVAGALAALVLFAVAGPVAIAEPVDPADITGRASATAGMVPLRPSRVLDTRPTGAVQPGARVTATLVGVPSTATAALVNVTATRARGDGYFTVWDCDGPAPRTSNGNYVGIDTVAASVITEIGPGATICIQAGDAATDILVDQMGYFAVGSGMVPFGPRRALDTRASGPAMPGTRVTVPLQGVPADASAVVVNVTATRAQGDGYFTVWDCDGPAPRTSNGNYVGVDTIANTSITGIGPGATVCLQTGDAAADLLVDVFGYFTGDSRFLPSRPLRALDSRQFGALGPGEITTVKLPGIDAGNTAVLNVTATRAQGDGYFTVWDCDGPAPGTSNGNYVGVDTIANSVLVPVSATGTICVTTGQSAADVLIDYVGQLPTAAPIPAAWTRPTGGDGFNFGRDVAALADGSAVVTGALAGTVTFGATTVDSPSADERLFVAKVDPYGEWMWVNTISGAGDTSGLSITALIDGSSIVSGVERSDVIIAKFTPNGDSAWLTRAGGPGHSFAMNVSALSDGSAIVTGSFSDSVTFGSTTLSAVGPEDVFVAKIDPSGSWVWATRAGGSGQSSANHVSTLPDGSAIVSGWHTGSATFGNTSLNDGGAFRGFVAKISAHGSWLWARNPFTGVADDSFAQGVSTFADGSSFITGVMLVDASTRAFVARLNADGSRRWWVDIPSDDFAVGYRISALADGSAVVSGAFTGSATFGTITLSQGPKDPAPEDDAWRDAFIARLDANGTWVWAVRPLSTRNVWAFGLDVTLDGSPMLAMAHNGSATFGATTVTLNPPENSSTVVVKMTPGGGFG